VPNYYACNWIIDLKTARLIYDARDLIDDLEGEVAILQWPFPRDDSERTYVSFGLQFPSDTTLAEFEEKVGQRWGLTHWEPITEDLFRAADINLTTEDRENIVHVFERFMEYGLRNFTLEITRLGKSPYSKPIEKLNLSVDSLENLRKVQIRTVGEVQSILFLGKDYFLRFPNFNNELFEELILKLREQGYWPQEDDRLIQDLKLDLRSHYALYYYGIVSVNQVLELFDKEGNAFFSDTLGFEKEALDQLKRRVHELGQ